MKTVIKHKTVPFNTYKKKSKDIQKSKKKTQPSNKSDTTIEQHHLRHCCRSIIGIGCHCCRAVFHFSDGFPICLVSIITMFQIWIISVFPCEVQPLSTGSLMGCCMRRFNRDGVFRWGCSDDSVLNLIICDASN